MAVSFDHTCWRAIQVDHPPDWELAVASGFGEPGTCVFSDRYSQRLQLQWKPLTYVPQLEHVLDGFRQKTSDPKSLSPLDDAPSPWLGLVRKAPRGCVTHAGRFFENTRILVEATIAWPARRDENLERHVLESVSVVDSSGPTRPWQAMGLDLRVDSRMDLRNSSCLVGRVQWEFAAAGRKGPVLSVERLALSEYWLDKPLREWLLGELPAGHKKVRQGVADINGHRCERLLSAASMGAWSSLRGLRKFRLDVAWHCPIEGRVYRVSYSQPSYLEELELPADLKITCCKAVPTATQRSPQESIW